MKPPALASWIVSRTIARDDERDMVLGDLHEQLPSRGRAWYWRQALSIAAHAIARRPSAADTTPRRGDFFMSILIQDIRYSWRSMVRRPLLTATIAITLALGLGANAAIFNLIDRLVLRPYSFADADRIVMLAETGPGLAYRKESVSPANFLDWRAGADSLAHLSAFGWWDANLSERDNPERIQGYQVSAGFFEALGLRPALGRTFVKDDETFGRHHVVVLSDALWKRRFGADPAIVGRAIAVDGEPYQVVGVMAPRFSFPDGSEIWTPLAFDPKTAPRRDDRYLTVVGRLQPGRALDEAQSQLSVMATRLAREFPDANRDHGVRVYTLGQGMLDVGLGPILSLWQTSALIVLLIACANIANLLLARAAERRREIAVRLALGAARGRIIRELLTESLLFSLVAVPPALGVAWLTLRAVRSGMPANIIRFVPGWESLGVDYRLLGFVVGLAVLTGCVFGVLPALQASGSKVSDALKEGGRSMTGRQLLRRGLVVAQISIALPLLVTAGLGVIGTNRFLNGPQGYNPDNLLTMKIVLPERTYPDEARRRQFVEQAVASIAAVPDVREVAIVNTIPSSGSNSSRAIEIDGRPPADPKNLPTVDNRVATANYFATMGIPLVRGRGFTSADHRDAAPVAIVSESMAAKFWPGEDPIGRRLKGRTGAWFTVVGISGDVIQDWYDRRNAPTMYRPFEQAPTDYLAVAIRTGSDPSLAAGAVRQALLRVDPQQPVFELMTMRQRLWDRTIGLRYIAAIMGSFALLALVLAAVGLYAVISYLVAQRRHEIGLRMALGASPAHVMRLTAGHGLVLALIGTAVGLAVSLALTKVIAAALIGIATMDFRVFAGFAAVLIATALVAGYLPARRAASIDPMVALRAE